MRALILAMTLFLCSCFPSEEEIVDECQESVEQAVADSWEACQGFFTLVVIPELEKRIEELEDIIRQECSGPLSNAKHGRTNEVR